MFVVAVMDGARPKTLSAVLRLVSSRKLFLRLPASQHMGSQQSSTIGCPTGAGELELRFIHRSVFDSDSPLPRFGDLPQHQKRVETFSMKLLFFVSDAREGLKSFLLISHRWQGKCHPDDCQEPAEGHC